jgi:ADP-ribosylglycohydrolase
MSQLDHLDTLFGPIVVMSLAERSLLPEPAGPPGPSLTNFTPELIDRMRGVVVGAAIGSALGAPFEWRNPPSAGVASRYRPARRGARPGVYTADVQLLESSLAASIEHGHGAPPHTAEVMRALGPRLRRPGNAVPAAIRRLEAGSAWFEAGVASFGNGAVVRALAAGLTSLDDPDWRPHAAALDCVLTHASVEAVAVSVVVADLVAVLLDQPLGQPDAEAIIDQVMARCADQAVAGAFSRVPRVLAGIARGQRSAIHSGSTAIEVVPAALVHALAPGLSAGEALVAAICAGGDTDTAGALAGAFLGALHGLAAFPTGWVAGVDRRDHLLALADRVTGQPVGHSNGHEPISSRRATATPPAPGDDGDDPVHVSFLLDRSGSMAALAGDVTGGFDAFITEQRRTHGTCTITVAQFDDHDPFELLLDDVDLVAVGPLVGYEPRGMTPLYDAIGNVITDAERRLERRARAGLADDAQLVVIFTDGLENASRLHTHQEIFERIEAKRAEDWTFVFLGANQDSYATGGDLGFRSGNVSDFPAHADGAHAAFRSISRAATAYRGKPRAVKLQDTDDFFEGCKEAEDPRLWK